jgi:hypothetical protein
MKFKFPYKGTHPEELIRKCGYGRIYNRHTDEVSFVRRLGRTSGYPRFHVYVNEYDKYFEVSLHLDQKKASYKGTSAHAGEYEGPQVENEARRITAQIAAIYGISV